MTLLRGEWEGLPSGLEVKNPQAMQEMQVQSLRRKEPLEEEMAAHSSILAWRIPWTEKPGGLQVQGVTKSWTRLSDLAEAAEEHMRERELDFTGACEDKKMLWDFPCGPVVKHPCL